MSAERDKGEIRESGSTVATLTRLDRSLRIRFWFNRAKKDTTKGAGHGER